VIDARIASDATAPTPGAPWWNRNVRIWLADEGEEKQEIFVKEMFDPESQIAYQKKLQRWQSDPKVFLIHRLLHKLSDNII
jgi:hypothetical protein